MSPATRDRPGYSILIPQTTAVRMAEYLESLRSGTVAAGGRLRARLQQHDLGRLTTEEFAGELLDTKRPCIFAESAVRGDGSDWNLVELGLLGDVSISVPCTIHDDGSHTQWNTHAVPFQGTLVYTPGALLRNDSGNVPADWNAVVGTDGTICDESYYRLYQRRLGPVFDYVNARAAGPRTAFVTVPGMGCGCFAGPFQGKLGARLQVVLERFLAEHGESYPNIAAVYFDPYLECMNDRKTIHGISFLVRPFTKQAGSGRSQLCRPSDYSGGGDDFSTCELFSIVAWDHVSWPGNDFYAGCRSTDDGVKAAATSSMAVLTGVASTYDGVAGMYRPPASFATWEKVVEDGRKRRGLRLWNREALWPRSPWGEA